jgi:hypothetical protein
MTRDDELDDARGLREPSKGVQSVVGMPTRSVR